MKKVTLKLGRIIDKTKYNLRHVIANTILKRRIDSHNDTLHIMDDVELIDDIVVHRKSFARFGDGELSLMFNEKFNLNFQDNSPLLRKRLKEVLRSDINGLILGISRGINNPSEYTPKIQRYYRTFNSIYRDKIEAAIDMNKIYGNTSITRFYIDYDTSNIAEARKRYNNISRIWENREILIIEGVHSRLGVGNNIFNSAKRIRRILIPGENAFCCYKKILQSAIKNVEKDELVLIAAGPTATILAYDLAKKGIQAIDIGHVDIEYEWMRMGATKRVAVKGKYVNEIKGKKYKEGFSHDIEYKHSIIDNIS